MRFSPSARVVPGTLVAALGLLVSANALAGGLRCSFGEVVINNLKICKSYSLEKLANLPLSLTNTDDKPSTVRVDALVPGEDELRQGAQAIPSATWASARPDSFVLAPNQTQSVELTIAIPDDERLFGKKFEVVYWSHTLAQAGNMIAYGLKSRVIFTIDQARDTAGAAPAAGELSIDFAPSQIVLEGVVRGREYRIEDSHHKPLVVRNTSARQISIELEPLSGQNSDAGPQEGYSDLLASAHLSLSPTKLSLEPGEEKAIAGTLVFPKGPSLKGKKFMCVISAAVMNMPVRTQIYSRILVHAR